MSLDAGVDLSTGTPGRDRVLLRGDLVAGHLEHVAARADERDAVLGRRLRQVGVLGEEPVAGVDRVGAALLGDPDDLGDVEVRPDRDDPPRRSGTPRRPSAGAASCGPRTGRPRPSARRARTRRAWPGSRSRRGWPPGSCGTCGPLVGSGWRSRARRTRPNRCRRWFGFSQTTDGRLPIRACAQRELPQGGRGKDHGHARARLRGLRQGLSTLVVDLDPQSDVSTGMDIAVAGHLNVADVLASPKEKIVRSAIAPSGWTQGSPRHRRRADRVAVGHQLRRAAPQHPRHLEARRGARARRERLRARAHRLRAVAQRADPHRLGGVRPRRRRHRARPVLGRRRRPRPARDRGDPSRALAASPAARASSSTVPACSRSSTSSASRSCATCSGRSCSRRSCPSAPRCSRRRAPRSRCTSGRARARRRWRATSTSCSTGCCAPRGSRPATPGSTCPSRTCRCSRRSRCSRSRRRRYTNPQQPVYSAAAAAGAAAAPAAAAPAPATGLSGPAAAGLSRTTAAAARHPRHPGVRLPGAAAAARELTRRASIRRVAATRPPKG